MSQILATERLSIELISEADASFCYQLMTSKNYLTHIGDRNIGSVADALKYIQENILPHYSSLGYSFYKLVLPHENKAIGIGGFAKRDYLDAPDIGYAILPSYERKGYIGEATVQLYKYGKERLGFQKIYGITSPANKISQQLLTKLGMQPKGTITDPKTQEEILLFL